MASTLASAPTGSSGPARVLDLDTSSPSDLVAAVRDGLPFTALVAIATQLDLPAAEIGVLLGIPLRTFARRRKSHQLTPPESDRLYRLARTFSQASEVLGSPVKARLWLQAANRALGGEVPLQLLDTDIGARQVEDVLLRLSYGVYS
ncbi:MAG: antitoxin Xre-like helix-turn-helix domain-containing protein [Synechococcaceae cyanobacterium ELA263]